MIVIPRENNGRKRVLVAIVRVRYVFKLPNLITASEDAESYSCCWTSDAATCIVDRLITLSGCLRAGHRCSVTYIHLRNSNCFTFDSRNYWIENPVIQREIKFLVLYIYWTPYVYFLNEELEIIMKTTIYFIFCCWWKGIIEEF